MERFFSVILILVSGCLLNCNVSKKTIENLTPKRPNIILIIADDLGYADLGCQGAKDLKTPYIDRLASEGVRATAGYVTAPQCSPSRCGILTGRYQQRFGFENNIPDEIEKQVSSFGLPTSEKTLADYLKQVGYKTALVGKWHLGNERDYHPLSRGFDIFFGFLGGSRGYFPNKNGDFKTPNVLTTICEGTTPSDRKAEYITDLFTERGVEIINENTGNPFFLIMSYTAPHAPMEATKKYLDRFPEINNNQRKTFAAMMSALDDGVGRLIEAVKKNGLDENTLIIFLSDNGGPTWQNASLNTPLAGYKGDVLEGGIRVPYIFRWKGHIKSGVTLESPISSLDILPTLLNSNQVVYKNKIDGVNLLPFLRSKKNQQPHEYLYFRFGPLLAARNNQFKWMQVGNETKTTEFYDIIQNISENTVRPSLALNIKNKLAAEFFKWNAEMPQPLWGYFPEHHIQYALKRSGLNDSLSTARNIYESFFGMWYNKRPE
jgi:arylsulfatase A-like enzyme